MKTKKISCPTCHKKDTWQPDNPFRPFCSERCKLIDLGAWAEEKYRVPAENQQDGHGSGSDQDGGED